MALVDVENLSFRYEGREDRALSSVNLRVEEGETVLLLGPSGSGKSTLALCLNGLIPHAIAGYMGGGVRVGALDTRRAPLSRLTQEVGLVFQDPEAQFVTMTVEDEVAFGLENLCFPPKEIDARIDGALSTVGMDGARRRQLDSLSGGLKQRVALASTLVMRPKVLVFDEPTANLDPAGTREFFGAVETLKHAGRHAIVLIEHKLDHLMPLIDRVVALSSDGCNLANGTPAEVFGDRAEDLVEHGVWMPQVSLLPTGCANGAPGSACSPSRWIRRPRLSGRSLPGFPLGTRRAPTGARAEPATLPRQPLKLRPWRSRTCRSPTPGDGF